MLNPLYRPLPRIAVLVAAAATALSAGCADASSDNANLRSGIFRTSGGSVVAGSAEVTVTIRNNITGLPIAGARVLADGVAVTTDANGVAQLTSVVVPATITAGANGFDLTSIVGVDARQVALGLNRKDPGVDVGRATITGTIFNLNPGDALDVASSMEHGDTFVFDGVTGNYALDIAANRTFTLTFARLDAVGTDVDAVLVPGVPPLANGGNLQVDVDFPAALGAETILTFANTGQVDVPATMDGGDVIVTTFGRDLNENQLDAVFAGDRFNSSGLVPTGQNLANVDVAAGNVPFNVEFNDNINFANLLLVSATTVDFADVITDTERLEGLEATLPNLDLDDPASAVAPIPSTAVVGTAPAIDFDANGFLGTGTGFWTVELRDTVTDDRWILIVEGGTTAFGLPDVSVDGTLAALGLTVGNEVEITITGRKFPGVPTFDFDAIDFDQSFGGLREVERTRVQYRFIP